MSVRAAGAALSASSFPRYAQSRWVIFVGFPVGVAVVAFVVASALTGSLPPAGSVASPRVLTILLVVSAILLPYSAAGGALGAVYGRGVRRGPCCGLLLLGAVGALPAGIVFALGAHVSWTLGLRVAFAAGATAQAGAALLGWVVGRACLSRGA